MVGDNAVIDFGCSFFIIEVSGQVSVIEEVDPFLIILDQSIGVGFPHDRFWAVDLGVSLIQQKLARRFPAELTGG